MQLIIKKALEIQASTRYRTKPYIWTLLKGLGFSVKVRYL